MTAKPSPGSRLPSWLSLLALFGAFLVFLAGWGLVLFVAFGLDAGLLGHLQDVPQPVLDVYTIGLYLGLVGLMALYWTWFEGRSWRDLGLAWQPRPLAEGLWLGFAGLATIYGLAMGMGWAWFAPPAAWPVGTILASVGAAAAMGLAEEVLFRGLLLRTLLRDTHPTVAIAASAVLYAVAHFVRPGLSLEQMILPFLGLTATGVLFAYAATSRGTLWLSAGMHAAWIGFITLSSQLNLWHYHPDAKGWTGNGYPPSGLLAALVMIGCFALLKVKNKQDSRKILHN